MIRSQKGISLLELMLVLAIMASVVVFGLRVFSQFRYQVDEKRIFANVDQLFLAMNNFYRANCRQTLDKNGNSLSPGRLDPKVVDPTGLGTISLNIQTDLVTPGFLTNWRPLNPLLDNSPTPDQGYYVQYIRVTQGPTSQDPTANAFACVGSTNPPSCDKTSGAPIDPSQPMDQTKPTVVNPAVQSHDVRWLAQVAVKLSAKLTSAQRTQIMQDLSAQCISSLAGSQVLPCTPTPAADVYIVWVRGVYNVSPEIMSEYWIMDPVLKQFVNQYTNDPMAGLSGVKNETTDSSTGKKWYDAQNYLCGG